MIKVTILNPGLSENKYFLARGLDPRYYCCCYYYYIRSMNEFILKITQNTLCDWCYLSRLPVLLHTYSMWCMHRLPFSTYKKTSVYFRIRVASLQIRLIFEAPHDKNITFFVLLQYSKVDVKKKVLYYYSISACSVCYFLCLSVVAACSTLKETHCDMRSADVSGDGGRMGRRVGLPGSPLILSR